jgi:molybdopterin synthase sulfur carrier subunit
MIRVLFFATIREMTREKETSVSACRNVRELLAGLSARYGESFRKEALEGTEVSDRLIVMVNGRAIAHTGWGDTPLSEGDTVAVFPVIGGG